MNRFKLLVLMLWLGVLMSAFPSAVQAGEAEVVAEDLRPVSGYIVMSLEEEFLVDLDASHGLRVGDLLSVVSPGAKIVHPITKEVIGSLDTVKAVLKVSRVKVGYSYARRISGVEAVAKGERVRRFAGLTASFQAPQEQGQELYDRLRELLPELEWQRQFQAGQEPGENGAPDLRFIRERGELRLVDRTGRQLRAYAITADSGTQQQLAAATPPPFAIGGNPAAAAGSFRWESAGVDFGKFTNMGELPGRVLMASFVKDNDRLLVATVDRAWVRVFDVTGGLQPVGATRVRSGVASPLAVSWWRPEEAGPLYLAVTAAVETEEFSGISKETTMGGAIYEWAGQELRPVVASTRYFLGTYDRNGDGQPETLLGQEFDLDQVYGRTFALNLDGNQLKRSKPPVTLPARFVLPGSAMGDLDGDGQPEWIMVHNEVLTIYAAGKKVYQSSEQMGGSLASLTYDVNPGAVDILFRTISLEVAPVLRDLDGDGIPELLAMASETSSLNVPGLGSGIKKSWVVVIKYRNGMFDKGHLAIERENPLQGIWEEEGQVYLVETSTTSTLSQEGKSNLLVFPLAQKRE